jgi:hypothetical protein
MRLAAFMLIGAIGALGAAAPGNAAPISPSLDAKQPSSISQVNYNGYYGRRHHGYYGHRYYGHYGRGYYPYYGGGYPYYRYRNWYGY